MDTFTRDGLTFDVTDSGPQDGPVAVLLHGFPQDRTSWQRVGAQLNAEGIRTLAPDQRGYSPRATPRGRASYAMKELVRDTVALIDASGADKVHLVGHDWGGALAWATTMRAPERLHSLTAVSTPHPYAMAWAMRHGGQWRKSWYMGAFQLPWLPEHRLAGGVGDLLRRTGAPAEDAERYDARFASPASLTGPLNWYRGMLTGGAPMLRGADSSTPGGGGAARRIQVPTTYIWGRRDFALGEAAARKTAEFVAAPYEFVELDAGHWLPETNPDAITSAVLSAVRRESRDS